MRAKKWYDYLWIAEIIYLLLGFFNILFAWLGMIFFLTPLIMALLTKNKGYCHKYCGRAQLFTLLGSKLSRNKPILKFTRTKYFRYGFLVFFMLMFLNMVFATYLVFVGSADLSKTITLFWTFNLPWEFANIINAPAWIAQYAFGFYSIMVTSNILGILTMALYKPRGFCVYCPMGTMTQGICTLRNKGAKDARDGGESKRNS